MGRICTCVEGEVAKEVLPHVRLRSLVPGKSADLVLGADADFSGALARSPNHGQVARRRAPRRLQGRTYVGSVEKSGGHHSNGLV